MGARINATLNKTEKRHAEIDAAIWCCKKIGNMHRVAPVGPKAAGLDPGTGGGGPQRHWFPEVRGTRGSLPAGLSQPVDPGGGGGYDIGTEILLLTKNDHKSTQKAPKSIIPQEIKSAGHSPSSGSVKSRFKAIFKKWPSWIRRCCFHGLLPPEVDLTTKLTI